MSAESEEVLGLLDAVLGTVKLALSRRERPQHLDKVAHRFGEPVNGCRQRAYRGSERLDHLDVVLDRLRRAIDGPDRVERLALRLFKGVDRVLVQHPDNRADRSQYEIEHQISMLSGRTARASGWDSVDVTARCDCTSGFHATGHSRQATDALPANNSSAVLSVASRAAAVGAIRRAHLLQGPTGNFEIVDHSRNPAVQV